MAAFVLQKQSWGVVKDHMTYNAKNIYCLARKEKFDIEGMPLHDSYNW